MKVNGIAARPALILTFFIASAGSALATPCEQVMAPIEARIRAKGVSDFRLEAVDQAASAPGQPVGTCELGRKKIMYVRGAGPAAPAAPAAPVASSAAQPSSTASAANAARTAPRVITECADGRVIEQGGSCRKK